MSDTLAQDGFAMPEPFPGTHQFGTELFEVGSTKVLEFAPLEQIPHALLRVQLWCVARKAFQMETFGSASGQKIFDGLRAMNACSVPDDQELAWDLAQEQLQEAHHIRPFERVVLNVHDQPSIQGQAANRREMIASQGNSQNGRCSHRGISAHGHRQQVKACLVYKDDRAVLLGGLFFSSTE